MNIFGHILCISIYVYMYIHIYIYIYYKKIFTGNIFNARNFALLNRLYATVLMLLAY